MTPRSRMVLELSGIMSSQSCDQQISPVVLPAGRGGHLCWRGLLFSRVLFMLLWTAFYPGDSVRSGKTREQEWGAGSGMCVLELHPWRMGMWHGRWGRGSWRTDLEDLTSPISRWLGFNRVHLVNPQGHQYICRTGCLAVTLIGKHKKDGFQVGNKCIRS